MSSHWFISPLTAEHARDLEREGVAVPADAWEGTAPTPAQVFAVVALLPEYDSRVRRRDSAACGEVVYIELRTKDGGYALEIHLLGVTGDDRPVGTFVFDYYRETEELVRVAALLAERCGPCVLWHDCGETSIVVVPPRPEGSRS